MPRTTRVRSLWFLAIVLLVAPQGAGAHPVPRENHDRTIVVHLAKEQDRVQVRVEYRLEVDEVTVLTRDMEAYRDEVDIADYRGRPLAYYAEFAKRFAPVFAGGLQASVNDKPLSWNCTSHIESLRDEKGDPLGHLRCDFVYAASFPLGTTPMHLEFEEKNYYLEAGQVKLRLVNDTGLELRDVSESEDQRTLSVTLVPAVGPSSVPGPTPVASAETGSHEEPYSLLRLFLHEDHDVWLLMLLAFAFGCGHALTPGHGKTLVAAYLVAERGTVWHAVALGIVTTLTHTGAVLAIAAVLFFLPREQQQAFAASVAQGLGLVLGLAVACMGFWLLLQRLSGRADHVHLGGGHHHDHAPPSAAPRTLTWAGLVVMGITGGLLPCWDAIWLLLFTVGRSAFWLALPALLAFSAGLACVLVVVGILVVQVPRFAHSRWGEGRLTRLLPIGSALVVMAMGIWMCYEGAKEM